MMLYYGVCPPVQVFWLPAFLAIGVVTTFSVGLLNHKTVEARELHLLNWHGPSDARDE
jgi:hypothetical protein